jgi:hypothetical protein
MTVTTEYEVGDPRRVLAMAETGRAPSELLWGSQDPVESLRMAGIIVNSGLLALTLNEHGAGSFSYLKGASAGTRVAYYIHHFSMGTITQAPMLLGQFLFEMEAVPEDALRLSPGGTNRIYFRKNGPGEQDKRIGSYDFLTPEEVEDTRRRLLGLYEKQVEYRERIDEMIGYLAR